MYCVLVLTLRSVAKQTNYQCFGSALVSMRIRIRNQGFDNQKLEKIYSWKKLYFFDEKLQFMYLSLGLHKERPSTTNRRLHTFKTERPGLQNMKFLNFFLFLWLFLPSWIQIRIQPTKINVDPCRSGSRSEALLITYLFVEFRSCGSVIHTILVF